MGVAGAILGLMAIVMPEPASAAYVVTDLVSDLPGLPNTDSNLVNPWGLARSNKSFWWVADNGTGVSTLYNGAGTPQPVIVTIPTLVGTGASAPTGAVSNPTSTSFGGAKFIFSTENGTIADWSGGASAAIRVDNSAAGTVYKGLAIGKSGGQDVIYATDFHNNRIDAFSYDATTNKYVTASLAGAFTDPALPAGYAPFGIQNIGGNLYVTYALKNATTDDDVPGAGHGFVDVFDTSGNMVGRVASGGTLNSPWGIALAPGNFGKFSNDLLIGNFGDNVVGEGSISAFDPTTWSFVGQFENGDGTPLTIDGLWALQFGGGNPKSGATDHLYFTAGIQDESHGLFGFIAVPEPASAILLLSALGALGLARRPRATRGL